MLRFARRKGTWVAAVVIGAIVSCFSILQTFKPSNSRNWKVDHERHARIRFDGDLVHIDGVRNFRETPFQREFENRAYDLDTIEAVWYVLSVFDGTGWRGPAHAMLSFGFSGGEYVVISVEARKEEGESYSALQGLFKKYELIYVIGDERDLILNRVIHRPDDVYMYPIESTKAKVRALFVDMLQAAAHLERTPEHYNTLANNCTSRLREHANKVTPGKIPPTWRTILPGYSDQLLKSLGILDSQLGVEAARSRYFINARAERFAGAEDFSVRIRESLQ